jgi:protein-S-isoprenylcysteine O-methyltransferase Ste14
MPPHAPTRERVLAWALVCAQLALIGAVVLWPGRRTWPVPVWLLAVSVALVLLGGLAAVVAAGALGPGLTASPLPNARARLRTSGPYAWVRHPIYTGLLVATAGLALASGRLARLTAWLLLVLLLWAKARWEERRLRARFPEYAAYTARTGRLVPRLPTRRTTPRHPGSDDR